jgi:hypothetical protein
MDEQTQGEEQAQEEQAQEEQEKADKMKIYNAEYQKMLFYCNSLIGEILKTTTVLNKHAQMLKIGQIKNEFNRRTLLLKEHFFKKSTGAAAHYEEAASNEEASGAALKANEGQAEEKVLVYYQHPENNIQLIIAEKSVPYIVSNA